jgi:hypothetical protein
MDQIIEIAEAAQKRAWEVIKELNLVEIWTSIGAKANLVGSLKTGLMINNKDIDFHIYTDPFKLSDSFLAMSRLAEKPGIRSISYTNLLEAEDKCIEWHAFYEDNQGETWQLDLIHILPGSTYAGHFEEVAKRICAALTPETRQAILKIKHGLPSDKKVRAIEVYQAVLSAGVRDLESFWKWKAAQPQAGIIDWMP